MLIKYANELTTMDSQTLTTIGIILEGLSVFVIAYEVFFGRKLTSLEVEGRGYYQRRRKERIRTAISFILLTIGLLLQIAGLYI